MIDARLARQVVALAGEAGRIVQRVRHEGVRSARKADRSLVTQADTEVDAFLRGALTRLVPAAWLSEETADQPDRLAATRLWVVDPLDGTREFVEGVAQYSVAIALVERGEPVLGVVHDPSTGVSYWAVRGGGAWRGDLPVRVREGQVVLASRSEMEKGEFDEFQGRWEVRPVGSIALKLAMVAAGDAPATWSRGPKHEWDVCAGAVLVAEAGGIVTDAFGEPMRFNQPRPKVPGILAGAPSAHGRALQALRATGPSARMRELD